MDKVAHIVGQKVGGVVEGAIKSVLGVKSKDDDKKGGGLSLFGGDKKKESNEGKGGFISNLFDRGDRNKGEKKSGFAGLFAEQEGEGATGEGYEGFGGAEGVCEYNEEKAGEISVPGGGMYDDLLEVATEMSKDN